MSFMPTPNSYNGEISTNFLVEYEQRDERASFGKVKTLLHSLIWHEGIKVRDLKVFTEL